MIKNLMASKHLEIHGLPQIIQFDGWPLISKKLWMVPDKVFKINEKPSNKCLKIMDGPYQIFEKLMDDPIFSKLRMAPRQIFKEL